MKKFLSITAVLIALATVSMGQSHRKLASNESTNRNPHFIDGITLSNIRHRVEEKGENNGSAKPAKNVKQAETVVSDTRPAPAPTDDSRSSRRKKNEKKSVATTETVAVNEPAVTSQERISTEAFMETESVKDPELYTFIDEWYATPYLYGGENKSGIDCSSFTQHLFNAVYNTDLVRTAAEQYNNAEPVPAKENLEKGDLVFFSINTSRISHVGFYLGNGKFVHASCSRGVMISDLNEAYWSRYFVAGGRIEKSRKKKQAAFCRN